MSCHVSHEALRSEDVRAVRGLVFCGEEKKEIHQLHVGRCVRSSDCPCPLKIH